jgi:hypothetical protein
VVASRFDSAAALLKVPLTLSLANVARAQASINTIAAQLMA